MAREHVFAPPQGMHLASPTLLQPGHEVGAGDAPPAQAIAFEIGGVQGDRLVVDRLRIVEHQGLEVVANRRLVLLRRHCASQRLQAQARGRKPQGRRGEQDHALDEARMVGRDEARHHRSE